MNKKEARIRASCCLIAMVIITVAIQFIFKNSGLTALVGFVFGWYSLPMLLILFTGET